MTYPAEPLASRKAPLTELERIEVAADLRVYKESIARVLAIPPLPGQQAERDRYVAQWEAAIARLERLLAE